MLVYLCACVPVRLCACVLVCFCAHVLVLGGVCVLGLDVVQVAHGAAVEVDVLAYSPLEIAGLGELSSCYKDVTEDEGEDEDEND